MSPRLIDITGRRFGRLTVLAIHPERVRHGKARKAVSVLWRCRCDCGTERVVYGSNLRQGFTVSCGCHSREKLIQRSTKHGQARRGRHTSIYDRWVCMRQRCRNPNHAAFSHYGGRGLNVCEYYDHSFENLYADMGDPPAPGMSIDRVDNDRGYERGNLRWATAAEQARNQRPRKKRKRRSSAEEIRAISSPGLAITLRPAAQSVGDIIDSAADPDALDDAIRLIWRGVSAGAISEEEAGILENRAQSKRPPRSNGQAKQICATPLVAKISRFAERQRPRSPDREASRRRWRQFGTGGVMPPEMRSEYTRAQLAVLWVVAREARLERKGVCSLPIDAIAALAGVHARTAQAAVRKAAELGHLKINARPRPGRKHLPNEVRIASRTWWNWISRRQAPEKSTKPRLKATL